MEGGRGRQRIWRVPGCRRVDGAAATPRLGGSGWTRPLPEFGEHLLRAAVCLHLLPSGTWGEGVGPPPLCSHETTVGSSRSYGFATAVQKESFAYNYPRSVLVPFFRTPVAFTFGRSRSWHEKNNYHGNTP